MDSRPFSFLTVHDTILSYKSAFVNTLHTPVSGKGDIVSFCDLACGLARAPPGATRGFQVQAGRRSALADAGSDVVAGHRSSQSAGPQCSAPDPRGDTPALMGDRAWWGPRCGPIWTDPIMPDYWLTDPDRCGTSDAGAGRCGPGILVLLSFHVLRPGRRQGVVGFAV